MTVRQFLGFAFHSDSKILVAAGIFLYFSIIVWNEYGLRISDLKKYEGTLISYDSALIKVKKKPLYEEITKKLDIRLKEHPLPFTLVTTDNFGSIVSVLRPGDHLVIHSKSNDANIKEDRDIAINNLSVNGFLIVDYYKDYAVTPLLLAVCIIPAIGFLTWYIVRSKPRYVEIVQKNTAKNIGIGKWGQPHPSEM